MERIKLPSTKIYFKIETRSIIGVFLYASFIMLVTISANSNSANSTNGTSGNETVKFKWVEYNDNFDCIVGISVDSEPVSSGVIVNEQLIITSANPIERVTNVATIKVHTIDADPKKEKIRNVYALTRDQSKRNSQFWRPFGFDDRHSPIHDLLLVTLAENIANVDNPGSRQPYAAKYEEVKSFEFGGVFTFAGFGFIDKAHVKANFELEPVEYAVENVLLNCDEWIPRVWGNFICLENNEHFVGISSGAGLFYNDIFVGIGSFSVSKGNESILVFTDVRKYNGSMFYETSAGRKEFPDLKSNATTTVKP